MVGENEGTNLNFQGRLEEEGQSSKKIGSSGLSSRRGEEYNNN